MDCLTAHAIMAHKTAEEREALMAGEYVLSLPHGRADCWAAAAVGQSRFAARVFCEIMGAVPGALPGDG
jgi:hypothetical protein